MADFKKLSAVEAVNTVSDAATVLIEEDGVIKRAPKTSISSGSNNSDLDAVFEIRDIVDLQDLHIEKVSLVSGDYNSLKDKIIAGEHPRVVCRWAWYDGDNLYETFSFTGALVVIQDDGSEGIHFATIYSGQVACYNVRVVLYPNHEIVAANAFSI